MKNSLFLITILVVSFFSTTQAADKDDYKNPFGWPAVRCMIQLVAGTFVNKNPHVHPLMPARPPQAEKIVQCIQKHIKDDRSYSHFTLRVHDPANVLGEDPSIQKQYESYAHIVAEKESTTIGVAVQLEYMLSDIDKTCLSKKNMSVHQRHSLLRFLKDVCVPCSKLDGYTLEKIGADGVINLELETAYKDRFN